MMRIATSRPVLALTGLIACLLCAAGVFIAGQGTSAPDIGGAFVLTRAEDGRAVTDRDFRGKFLLVYFGYTFCPDVCPTTLADLAAAMKDLGPAADKIQPVFITIDPSRDTPDVLKAYLVQFSPAFTGLTGTQKQITVVERAYKMYAMKTPTGNGPNDYVMDHSSLFYLMSPNGRFVAVLPADRNGQALAADLGQYVE